MKKVYLEITNACNLNCPFCTYEKGQSYMNINDIDNYLKQIKPYCDYIYLHIIVEPLLHPNFNEILNLLDQYQMHLQLVTNGLLLSKYPDLLNHSCLRKLSISIHSINNIDISKNYFETIDNIIDNHNQTIIDLRFYDFDNLDDNLLNYYNYLLNKYPNYIKSDKQIKLTDNIYITQNDYFNWPRLDNPIIGSSGTCRGAIDMIAINVDSDVTICCLDPKAINKIGNLKTDTLDNILNSETYLKYLDEFKNHQVSSDLCQRCTYRLRFK